MVIKKLSEHRWLFCLVLIALGISGPMAADMYAPAMPAQAKALMTSMHVIELSITLYMGISFMGLLIYGSLSDCFGRKRMLAIGLVLGAIGSLICWAAPSIRFFFLGRLIQALGFSATPCILPAMARDVFNGTKLAQVASIISVAFGLSPLISPIIGGYVSSHFGWRMIFIGISFYVLASMFAMVFIPETHTTNKRSTLKIKSVLNMYRHILKDHNFLKNMFSKSIAFICYIIFFTLTPFMLEDHLHLTPVEYGWVTLALTAAILFAKALNTFLLSKFSLEAIIVFSNILLFGSSILLLSFAFFNFYSVTSILLPFTLMGISCGFLFSNTSTAAFKSFNGLSSGSVAGLLNGMQRLFACAGSAIAAHLAITSLMPLALLMTLVTGFSLVQYVFFGINTDSLKRCIFH